MRYSKWHLELSEMNGYFCLAKFHAEKNQCSWLTVKEHRQSANGKRTTGPRQMMTAYDSVND